ncbi:MAG: RNA polymerase sigma factor [Bacteroidales bacterium]|nr:RNA polymerase sigma factor [Bacteroidales bacterium]
MGFEDDLIQDCLRNDNRAQETLYKRFAPKMYGVCMRFAKNRMEADDIMQEAFIKIFVKLETFRNEGSLEGWIRRTIINTAINYFKKHSKHLNDIGIEQAGKLPNETEGVVDSISLGELLNLIQELPDGYRIVFNLNVIEGYTHREIGELLEISENTSKSQLSRARHALQKRIHELYGNNK